MASVILIYPHTGLDVKGVSVWLPLALLNVASTLVHDHDVVIVDQRFEGWRQQLKQAITDDSVCVGISSMTGTQITGGIEAARVVREINPDLPIVWGGNHPTLVPESTARHPLVDIVVMGEGETAFRRLVEALEQGTAPATLPDICIERDGQIIRNGTGTDPKGFAKPDTMPPLPYHLVDVERYVCGPGIFGRPLRALPYIGSTGCAYACTFCCQPVLSSRRWRKQSPEIVVERALRLKEKYRLDAIEFHDEEFFVDRKRGMLIADLIGGQFEWYVQTRMDDLLALDLDALFKAGLRVVQPGLETGSERILEMIKKGETLNDFHRANRLLARSGIKATYNFMMGYPTENEEELVETVDLALKLLDETPNSSVSGFYVYVPYPGAELFKQAVRDGFCEPETLEGWSVFNRQHLASPWIGDRRDMLEMLLFTSKFIDGKRLRNAFGKNPVVSSAIRLMSSRYRRRWRKHDFRKTIDIDLLAYAARHCFGW